MSDSNTCIRCGRELPADHDASRPCAACLLELGLGDSATEAGEHFVTGSKPSEPAPTPEELAADFPQLEILELIGSGGMGFVYRARQRSLGREVALKVLLARSADDAEFAERFAREAKALAGLNHPGIVAIHDFGVAGERHYLVMELVRGTNLRHAMRSADITPAQALELVRQVCDALQFAHEHGVVHRDIKPENVLLDERGRAKIADFGLAKMLDVGAPEERLTGSGHRMGTPLYMAPEQVENPTDVDHRADIYSLGVVFYELLTGELPLGRFAPPSRKVAIDVRLDEVVLRSLAKEPELRYQQASEVKTDLEGLSGAPNPKQTEAMSDSAAPKKRSIAPWILVVLLLGSCLIVPLACGAFFLGTGVRTMEPGEMPEREVMDRVRTVEAPPDPYEAPAEEPTEDPTGEPVPEAPEPR
jgi:serine/threonine protein kinase